MFNSPRNSVWPLIATLLLLAACGADRAATAKPLAQPLTESDRMLLREAAAACTDADANAFFDVFIQSAAVRRKYSARTVTFALQTQDSKLLRRSEILGSRYLDFPIMMVDYYRKPARPLRPGDDDEYVEISIYKGPQNQLAVEWTRVHYDGRSDGGDDLGNAITLDGKPYDPAGSSDGQLLFRPAGGCWELESDIRYESHGTP